MELLGYRVLINPDETVRAAGELYDSIITREGLAKHNFEIERRINEVVVSKLLIDQQEQPRDIASPNRLLGEEEYSCVRRDASEIPLWLYAWTFQCRIDVDQVDDLQHLIDEDHRDCRSGVSFSVEKNIIRSWTTKLNWWD